MKAIHRHSVLNFLLFAVLLLSSHCNAQSLAERKAAQRYEVDAKRMGVDVNSEDALPRSREFIRIDSTYYVGWMFEGAYKYNHAADYLGFKNASVPLERALRLMERDYKKQLSTRTANLMTYFQVYKYHLDYTLTANYLMTCYANMEEQQQVFNLLRRVAKWNFQRDFYMDVYNYLGWTVHRNRFYTNAKYPFLKNSIDANERLANSYLDTGLMRIAKNKPLNEKIFQPGYEKPDLLAVYHYKSILYSYVFNIDSAEFYYGLMRDAGVLPHNNYATFKAITGYFRIAENEYRLAGETQGPDKRLQEWVYYSSMLDIYKALPKTGIDLTKGMIKANGSTPGFGWYNIAVARCLLYDGQNEEALHYINKAAAFKELHIGTTLGQTHYDFSIQLLKLVQKLNELEAQKFENSNWWYNPQVLGNMAKLTAERYLQQFLIINQFAQNPERDRVVYKLFSTESTVSWDEIWYLLRDFSTKFFLQKFQKEQQQDKRKNIVRYYQYFIAKLNMQQGNYNKAMQILNTILANPTIDAEYEKLLLARVLQAQAECAKETNDETTKNERLYRFYQYYPQLVPYTGLKMNMRLHISGAEDKDFVNRLKSCNINWIDGGATPAPEVHLVFKHVGNKKSVGYYVMDNAGRYMVKQQNMSYNKAEDAVKLAYRLFGVGDNNLGKKKANSSTL